MNALLLLLLDSRAPTGAHQHSGGMEAAVGTGLVSGLADLEDFCRTRLRTSARVCAAFAAASARLQSDAAERSVALARAQHQWAVMDAEFEARTPSEAMRTASRQLGRGLLRLVRSVLPEADLVTPLSRCAGPAPHHPLVLGAGVGLGGRDAGTGRAGRGPGRVRRPGQRGGAAARPGPVRRAGHAGPAGARRSTCARRRCAAAAGPPSALPADAAPALDLLADFHLTAEVRLFAS